MEIVPAWLEIATGLPSAAAADKFPSWTVAFPDAADDRVTFNVATAPSGIVLAFMP